MNELHLFAGAGGGILLGHTCICAVEIEPYCRKVLLQRQRDGILPKFPIWDDVRTFDGKPWRGKVDVVCGGFPCTNISVAGDGAGIDGEESKLWKHQARIVGDIRPDFMWMENSSALVIRGLGTVLGDLAEMGYDATWGVFRASDVGAPHRRDRIYLLAYPYSKGLEGGKQRTKPRFFKVDNISSSQHFPRKLDDLPKPILLGNGHGLANFVERSRAIGNGQVPAVVKLAWKCLSQ